MNSQNMRMTPWRVAAVLSALMLGGVLAMPQAFSAPVASTQDVLSAQSESGISYLNGGIGADEQAQMRRDARDWPLHMTFSEGKDGAFVADAQVKITNKAGKSVFALNGAGPLTYVKLSPGEYRVTADHKGKMMTRQVHVDHKGENLYFRW